MIGESSEMCSSCAYWVKNPTDPMNLTAAPVGQCRGAPPALMAIPTQQGINFTASYPTLPPNFPACGMHTRKELPVLNAGS